MKRFKCGFDEAWRGKCQQTVVASSDHCEKHDLVCKSCGSPATRECDQTGQFVCGAPLCDECEHTIALDGTNGGIGFAQTSLYPEGLGAHCKKSEQKALPWYERN